MKESKVEYVPFLDKINAMIEESIEFEAAEESVDNLIELKQWIGNLVKALEDRAKDAEIDARLSKEYKRTSRKAFDDGRALVYREMIDILKGKNNNTYQILNNT